MKSTRMLIVALAAPLLFAQTEETIRPGRYPGAAGVRVPSRQLPSARLRLPHPVEHHFPPLKQEEIDAFRPKGTLEAAGLHRKVEAGSGSWQSAGGERIWRMAVRASAAQAVRVHFTEFDAGRGRVWVHDGSGGQEAVAGPYTGRGPYGDGDFWSDVVFGETAVVEYEPEDPSSEAVPFRVAEITHVFRGLEPKSGAVREAALACHLDVSCYPEWAESAKAVARMLFEVGQGAAYCSGALVMDRNRTFTPYFLTADHCISNDTEARSLITYWFYQTAGCNQRPPNARDVPRATGARYLAGGAMDAGDFTLLRLNEVPSGVTFMGWNPSELAVGTRLTGIHHPAGDYKRISLGQRGEDRANGFSRSNHYTVNWNSGHTEGGSSGSPIFSEPGVIAGVLSGGPKVPAGKTQCDINPDRDYYGKFSVAYPSLRDYLDGRSSVTGPSAGGRLLNSGVAADFSFNVNTPTLFTGNSGYRIEVPAGVTALEVQVATDAANADVTLVARLGAPPTVSNGSIQADTSVAVRNGRASLRLDATSAPPLRAGTWYFGLAVLTTGVDVTGRITATTVTGNTPPPGAGPVTLLSGTPRSFSLPSVSNGTLFNGNSGFRVVVPEGATKLEVKVVTSTPGADVDLFVRYGVDIELASSRPVSDYQSTRDGGDESVTVTASSSPPLKAGTYYVALALFTPGMAVNGTITATIETARPPQGGGPVLVSGTAREISLDAITSPRLFADDAGYRIVVPEGATRLEVRTSVSPASADVDLFVRYNSAPALSNGSVVADFKSAGPAGDEVITITPASSPALRAGTYYIGLALFTVNQGVKVTLTATVSTSSGSAPATVLTSGVGRNFIVQPVASAVLLGGAERFQIAVPQGARRLVVQLRTATRGVDLDLYVRFNQEPEVRDTRVVADYSSSGDAGEETITVTSSSSPPLRAGTYYIGLAMFTTGVAATANITATVEMEDSSGGTVLTSGVARTFSFAPVTGATLMTGDGSYRVVVPEGAGRLQVRAVASTAGVDIDLYVRYGSAPVVQNGQVVADYQSTSSGGDETVTVNSSSSPPLRAGTYYATIAVRTTGTAIAGSITATVTTSAPAPAGSVLLSSGVPAKFSLPAVDTPTLFTGDYGFRVEVPRGATRLQVRLLTNTANVDTDLYIRLGSDVDLANGEVVADYESTSNSGNETITVTLESSKPLKPGVYYIGMAMYTTGIAAEGTVVATVESAPSLPVSTGGTRLESGREARFSLPAVSDATLYTGEYAYRVTVPEGAERLVVRLATETPGADLDLFVRYGSMPEVAEGRVTADYASTSDSGDELVSISPYTNPRLRAGDYYIALAVFTKDTPVTGTVTATLTGGKSLPVTLTMSPVKLKPVAKSCGGEIPCF